MSIADMMTSMPDESEERYAGKMETHTEMLCEVFKTLGKIEAKLDRLIADEMESESESAPESESEQGAFEFTFPEASGYMKK